MCFDFDARPPELPTDLVLPRLAGGAAAERLELEAADGNRFAAALAQAEDGAEPGVIVLPDVRGLYRFYVELAERFVVAGRSAIAIDYFGRTAGVEERDEQFEFMPHVMATTPEGVQRDVAAAADALRERTGTERIVTLGFCFGGAQSFLAAGVPELGLAGAIGFYGTLDPSRIDPGIPATFPAPLRHVGLIRCPVLGLFGGDDQYIPAEDIAAFGEGLAAAGVPHELITYPSAPHSFFDRAFEEHAEASADAWRRTIGFLDAVAAASAPA